MVSKSQVKYIQSLNDKKFRKEQGQFIAEGPRLINDLLTGGSIHPVAIYALAGWGLENKAVLTHLAPGIFTEVDEQDLKRISLLATPNQVLGIFKQPVAEPGKIKDKSVTILLDGIQDPGNMGTIVRIADWFGITRIVASMDTVDVYNPKVVQSTMGSIARVQVSYADLPEFISLNSDVKVYACVLNGKPLSSFGRIGQGMLLIGNEAMGISEALLKLAHHHITIERIGKAESLNAAVATGIVLSHIV